ncbi:MAG: DUF192 domain-containing protein [Patescibacteria group bacterium]|nr:DUF192 domain-containing protein [Patescibacteria group bacterium]MDD5121653.1 DUF192 domain-containing protein [Patescibacteria group bacterium]MDD5396183.1 DUF192 domain-containing protein [Patescibacteria group bacterium]
MKNKWHLIIFLLITAIILFVFNFVLFDKQFTKVTINQQVIKAETVTTSSEIIRGLSGRQSLADNSGMLFVFPKVDTYDFWMKDMKFSIDIIWINDGRIIDIWQNAPIPQNSQPARYHPRDKAGYVLEVGAGTVEKNGWKIGDFVKLGL